MKKQLLILSLICCMLLMACGTNVDSNGEVKETELQGTSEILLYEKNGLVLNLKAVYSIEGNRNVYVLQMTNHTDQEYTVSVSEWMLNDTYLISEEEFFFIDPLDEEKGTLEEMSEVVYLEKLNAVNALKFHIFVRDANYERIDEQDIELKLTEPLVHDVDYDAYMNAKADKQVLTDDENVKMTLIEWGRNPDNNYLSATVLVENQSNETIPVIISGMSLNDIYFRTTERVNILEPGQRCYSTSNVLLSDVENEGITSITDVKLMILTDEAQNTGSVSYAGGQWYPILLDEKGEASETFVTGEPLEDIEEVHISYIGQEEKDWSNGGGYYRWKLSVTNEGDENVKVSLVDVLIDGIPEERWHEDMPNCSLFLAESEVGAHSNRYIYITLSYYEEKIARPELNFKFQLRSMAGGAVIGTGEEQITITPDS